MKASPGGKPQDFIDCIRSDGTVDRARFSQLLLTLSRTENRTQNQGRTIVVTRPSGNTGGGGTGGQAGSQNPGNGGGQAAEQAPVLEVQASGVVEAGMFVNYTATTGTPAMALADNRDATKYATHYVVSITNGIAVLVPVYAVGQVIYGSGRGANADANLYLYQEGTVTDDYEDIRDSDFNLQPGVALDQLLGWRITEKRGAPPTAGNSLYRVSATVSIQRAQN